LSTRFFSCLRPQTSLMSDPNRTALPARDAAGDEYRRSSAATKRRRNPALGLFSFQNLISLQHLFEK
jgi:hypothetical protein